jgi:membrane protein DedA with SNARE-associated domain
VHQIIQFVLRHGHAVIFLAALAEQIGIPVPAAPVLLAAGTLIGLERLHLAPVLAFAVLACLVADFVWYELGVHRGERILALLCRISLEPDTCVRQTQDLYRKYGPKSLLFCKWVPGLGTVSPPLAGAFGLPRWKFLLFDGAGSVLWAASYVLLGWLFRTEIEWLAGIGANMGSGLAVVVLGGLAGYILWKYAQRRKIFRELRIARISPHELKERMDKGEDILLIDYRHPGEWMEGIIPGALTIRREELDLQPPHLFADREVVLYCS